MKNKQLMKENMIRRSLNNVIYVKPVKLLVDGDAIYYARCQKGLTQDELAKLVGCTQVQIGKYEKMSSEKLLSTARSSILIRMSEILIDDNSNVVEV